MKPTINHFFLLVLAFHCVDLPARSESMSSIIQKSVGVIEAQGADGSAFVIGKKENRYLGLTAAHVLDCENVAKEENYIYLPSAGDQRFKIEVCTIPDKKYDIALFEFNSPMSIQLLPFATNYSKLKSDMSSGDFLATANAGRVSGYSLPTAAIKSQIYRSIHLQFMPFQKDNEMGYDVLYPAATITGMSGGPVVGIYPCSTGFYPVAIAVHGRSEDYQGAGRSGVSLGVPISLIDSRFLNHFQFAGSDRLCTSDPWN